MQSSPTSSVISKWSARENQNSVLSLVGHCMGSVSILLQYYRVARYSRCFACKLMTPCPSICCFLGGKIFPVNQCSKLVFLRHWTGVISIHFAQERAWIASEFILLFSSLQTLFLPLSSHSHGYHSFLIGPGELPQTMACRQCVSH